MKVIVISIHGMGSIEAACISGFLCRLCSEMHRTVIHIYGDQGQRHGLAMKINAYLPVTVGASLFLKVHELNNHFHCQTDHAQWSPAEDDMSAVHVAGGAASRADAEDGETQIDVRTASDQDALNPSAGRTDK